MPEFIIAGNYKIPQSNVVIGMVESVSRRVRGNKYDDFVKSIDVIIVDETHRGEFTKIFEYFGDKIIIGFTATSYRRAPQKPLSDYFNKILLGPSVKELIKRGSLVPAKVFGRKLDMKNIGVRAGEYKAEDQEVEFEAQGMYKNVIKHYKKYLDGKKSIVFTPSLEVSRRIVDNFNNEGISAVHIDGTTPKTERDRIIDLYKSGDIKIISNYDIVTTGFDDPGVEGIILFLATRSLVKYLQILGRGARPYEGKQYFTVLD